MNQGRRFIQQCIFLIVTIVSLVFIASAQTQSNPRAILLTLDGAVGPATQDYVVKGIDRAAKEQAQMVVLLLDTPGGLDTSMRGIISHIIDSPVPVITYVSPSGARAASAGTYILYASHVAVMAPGTNVGAATPVSITPGNGDKKDSMSASEKKAVNDASAYLRSLAQLRHRNINWAEQAVRQGVSISANEALELNVIDLIATNLNDLTSKLNGRKIQLKTNEVSLNTDNLVIMKLSPDWRSQFLAIITNPNIAYILLLVGVYGLLFEFLNPGFILPGVAGLISLLIALYAFQLLPINYVGLALIIVGMAFIVAEIFVTSFGALGIGGIIAFIIGSIMLFDSNVPGFTLLLPVIIGVALVTAAILVFIVQLALRAHRRPVVSGREEIMGSEGTIIMIPGEKRPRIRIRGELWQVQSDTTLHEGQQVRVVAMDELILRVVPVEDLETKKGTSI